MVYGDADPVAAVRRLTGDLGAHVVFDSVAGPGFARSFRMLRNGGTVVLCGRAAGDPDLAALGGDFIAARRGLALRDFYLAAYLADHLAELPARLADLASGIIDGSFTIPVTVFSLDEARHAHRLMEARSTVGKLVLRP